jgi:osmotically-inducible protein OsmY
MLREEEAMTDHSLEQAVCSALYLDPLLNAARIDVAVHESVVTLTGYVGTYAQKIAAKQKAECVPGVKSVTDRLEVDIAERPGREVDEIAAGVLNALYWDLAVPDDRVSATCVKGWVTLSGEVDRPYQKTCAEADVRNIRGVIGVTNEIKVILAPRNSMIVTDRTISEAPPPLA